MDLRQLRTLSEVVDRGSFSAAAEALGISQPAVSQQIRALESDVGAKLLERGRRTRLTDRGRMVDRYARRMLALGQPVGKVGVDDHRWGYRATRREDRAMLK